MKSIGTILPTRESLRLEDYWHAEIEAHKRKVEKNLPGTLVIDGSEHRYYTDDNHYSIVDNSFHVRKFERRADGYFYAVR